MKMTENIWAIIDNKGIIHDGREDEMRIAFDVMSGNITDIGLSVEEFDALNDKYVYDWEGDLKLIQVHKIYR